MFLNRTRELGYLSERYAAGRAEIVVLYGRRRVGKSALLFEWSDGKPCIFFFARTRTRRPCWVNFHGPFAPSVQITLYQMTSPIPRGRGLQRHRRVVR